MSPVTRRRRWPWALALLLVLCAAAWLAIWGSLESIGTMPVDITIDGERVLTGFDLADLPDEHKAGLAAILLFALLAVGLVVPLSLLMALTGVVVAMLLVAGLILLALLLTLSPLLLLGWLLWRVLRQAPAVSA